MSPPPAEAVVDTLRGGEVLGGITSIDGGGFGWQREARRRIFGEGGKVREIVESGGKRGRKETRNWVLEQQRKKSGGSSSEAGGRGLRPGSTPHISVERGTQ